MFRNALARLKESHLATRLDRWMTGAIAVLLIALGFVGGRWTSLTSTATPIVFQEAAGDSSAATPEELRGLVAGEETPKATPTTPKKETKPPDRATQAPNPSEARGSGQAPNPQPPTATKEHGAFVASANGEKYYRPDCSEVRRIKEENKIWFDSEQEAKDSGYEPSVCVQKGK